MKRRPVQWLGLTGLLALLSYTAAVVLSPLDYPGYDWMAQAVSDLSAESAPSRLLWEQLAAPYGICSVVCATAASLYVVEQKGSNKWLRSGIGLFAVMNWVSAIGYRMFPLVDAGKEIFSFQEQMHMVVTMLVVILSVASLAGVILAAFRDPGAKRLGVWAGIAFVLMMTGAVGHGIVAPGYFGLMERFSVFAAAGFNAVLGWMLFRGFPASEKKKNK